MKQFLCLLLLTVAISGSYSLEQEQNAPANHQKSLISSIIRQLDGVSDNLNQLQVVLSKLGSQLNYATANERSESSVVPLSKMEQSETKKLNYLSKSAEKTLLDVNSVKNVVNQLTDQLTGLLGGSKIRQRRSLSMNEANLDQLSQLVQLFRNGPTAFDSSIASLNHHQNSIRKRRQAPQGILSSTAQSASNGLQDLLQVATNLSNGIRRRLSTISTQIADLTANGILSVNAAATQTVNGATSLVSSAGTAVVNSVNSVTGQISSAITNGVKQANQMAQNTLG